MADGFGKYDVYAVSGSVYCYGDTGVLKNRLGIRDGKTLKRLEADITTIRQNDLLTTPIPGRFTANHLCRIHRYLFGDLYPFAGHFRREDIMKGTTRFLTHRDVKMNLTKLLYALASEKYLSGLDFDTFADRSAYYFAELNYIHPFREGNGRTTREFMRLLFAKNGYDVDWAKVSADHLLSAMEASVFDTTELKGVLQICLQKMDSDVKNDSAK